MLFTASVYVNIRIASKQIHYIRVHFYEDSIKRNLILEAFDQYHIAFN